MVSNQSHNAIQASEQRYRQLFDNMPICIIVVNLASSPVIILEVNRRAELIYGYSAAELIGNPASRFVPEESMASARTIIQRVRRGETVKAEITTRHRDGTPFPVRVVATNDPTNHGHMLVTLEDISAESQRRMDVEAIEYERLRIAHEIHDGVAQNLAGLRLKSALWHHLADAAPPEMRSALGELQSVLAATIEDIRRAIFALRPLDMESQGFFPALRQWVAGFSEQDQLAVKLELSGEMECLPTAYELPLYRIIQEGLNNIYQHARATTAQVQFTVDSTGGVVLLIRDDGRGFDPSRARTSEPPRHFGLLQMRERIQDLGGTLDIHSIIGQGTELLINLPGVNQEVNATWSRESTHASD